MTEASPAQSSVPGTIVESDIPGRLDRLPWIRWHWLVVVGLGVTWVLDGLEVTLAGAVGAALTNPATLGLRPSDVGLSAAFYLAGAVVGALLFGYATDRFGRKKLFFVTLAVYLAATAATAFAFDFRSFALFRFLTGLGIGGEYAAINSAVDELIPARLRGRVDLMINATYWIGAALGAGATVVLLDPARFPVDLGWRLAFGIGAAIGLGILLLRRFIPESPRWLMTHGRGAEADAILNAVEDAARRQTGQLPAPDEPPVRLRIRSHTPLREVREAMLRRHRSRSLLGLALMAAQAFFYNAVFFTYALVLQRFYGVAGDRVGAFLLAFALGNAIGPFILGPLFDTIGRKPMIALTYALSGGLLALTGLLFAHGYLSAWQQTACWTAIFFIASAAASSAYLTVSEIFPLEIRAMAIAVFYAFGTLIGGVVAPICFAALIEAGSRSALAWGYAGAGGLMIGAAILELWLGVAAERRSLESVSTPLSSA